MNYKIPLLHGVSVFHTLYRGNFHRQIYATKDEILTPPAHSNRINQGKTICIWPLCDSDKCYGSPYCHSVSIWHLLFDVVLRKLILSKLAASVAPHSHLWNAQELWLFQRLHEAYLIMSPCPPASTHKSSTLA